MQAVLWCQESWEGRGLILSSADLDGFGRGRMSTASAKGYKYGIKFPFLYATLPSRKVELPQYFHSCKLVIFAIMVIQSHFCSRAVCLAFRGPPIKVTPLVTVLYSNYNWGSNIFGGKI